MSSNKNIPQLRFPEFTGEWEEHHLEELCKIISTTFKLQSRNYLEKGKYPIVDQSQSLICGWTNDDKGLIKKNPVIIFGDHTCLVKYIDFPFVQGADGVKILSPQEDYDSRFLFQSFLANPVLQDGYKRHFSDMKEKSYFIPSKLNEQKKLADFLFAIDNMIQAQGKRVDALKEKKKGMVQQMFPQKGETTPRLRFPEFVGEWEKKRFREFTFVSGKRNKENLPYERYSISNEVGFCPQKEQFEGGAGYLNNIDCSKHIIVSPKTFAYNPARINIGSIGYQNLDKDVIVSPLYEIFKTTDDCNDIFLWHWFHSNTFKRMVLNGQEGGVRLCFSYNKLKDCYINLPSLEEQQKIAECLSAMDDVIASETAKLDALKEHKKGLMQQMFPQPTK